MKGVDYWRLWVIIGDDWMIIGNIAVNMKGDYWRLWALEMNHGD